jgi:hypothetical protein
MDPATGSIISAGISAIGGLFGEDKGPSMIEQGMANHFFDALKARQQPTFLRIGAEKAGFNPLTVLRSMGGTSASPVQNPGPSISSAKFIADALGDAVETWANREQIAQEAEFDRLKIEMAKEELEYWKQRNATKPVDKNFGFGLTGTTRTTSKQVQVAPVLSEGDPEKAGNPLFTPPGVPETTKPNEQMPVLTTGVLPNGSKFAFPAIDGEPVDIWQIPVLAAGALGTLGFNMGQRVGDWVSEQKFNNFMRSQGKPQSRMNQLLAPSW